MLIGFSLSVLVFGFHYHAEEAVDDDVCHISLYASPGGQQVVLKAVSNDNSGPSGFSISPLSHFISPDSLQITPPPHTRPLIPPEQGSSFAFFSHPPFSHRAPPAL